MEELEEAQGGVQRAVAEAVEEGKEEERERVPGFGKEELFGYTERRGPRGGAGCGNGVFQSFGGDGEVRGTEGGFVVVAAAAEGGEEAVPELPLRQGFRDESCRVPENF